MKYAWIAKNRAFWPITLMCDMLGVSTSGYFEHRQRSTGHWPSQLGVGKRISNEALLAHIRAIHACSCRTKIDPLLKVMPTQN